MVYVWPVYQNLDKRTCFTIIFLPLKQRLTLFQIWIFFNYTFTYYMSQLVLSRIDSPKSTSSILMENCGHSTCPGWPILFLYALAHKAWLWKVFFEIDASSYSVKITCILLRQSPSLKKMDVSWAKSIILISWYPIFTTLTH